MLSKNTLVRAMTGDFLYMIAEADNKSNMEDDALKRLVMGAADLRKSLPRLFKDRWGERNSNRVISIPSSMGRIIWLYRISEGQQRALLSIVDL